MKCFDMLRDVVRHGIKKGGERAVISSSTTAHQRPHAHVPTRTLQEKSVDEDAILRAAKYHMSVTRESDLISQAQSLQVSTVRRLRGCGRENGGSEAST